MQSCVVAVDLPLSPVTRDVTLVHFHVTIMSHRAKTL
jgi:hypothetical protein